MLFSHLSFRHDLIFGCASAALLISLFCFHTGRKNPALLLLFLGTLGLGYFISTLDPFLLLWDEQYHALVAKNMIQHPLKPTLYEYPLLPYDYTNWTFNHVWLHKQPLFLWQIMLSLRVFGINEVAVRIPDILQHALTALMVYRIGKITYNANAGFYGALLFAVASYPLELIVGRHATDHNDTAFIFYFTASFWSWFEYKNSGKVFWIVLTGVFAGGAVLVKWLTGMMVYLIWFIALLIANRKQWWQPKIYGPLIISAAIACLVFIPWQWYIFRTYPLEAAHEFNFNTHHFFQPLEDHGGDWWFHFRAMWEIYGLMLPLVAAGVYMLLKNASKRVYSFAIGAIIFITYGFFTMAATKMVSFCIIAAPFMLLALGSWVDGVLNALKEKVQQGWLSMFIKVALPFTMAVVLIDLPLIENFHTAPDPKDHCGRKEEMAQMRLIEQLKNKLGDRQAVVFNASARPNGYIEVMFYTPYIAYPFIPDQQQIASIHSQHYSTAVVVTDSLPDYIMQDSSIIRIPFPD